MANDSAAENVVQMRPTKRRKVEAVKPPMTDDQHREAARRGIAAARRALAKARVRAVPDGQ